VTSCERSGGWFAWFVVEFDRPGERTDRIDLLSVKGEHECRTTIDSLALWRPSALDQVARAVERPLQHGAVVDALDTL